MKPVSLYSRIIISTCFQIRFAKDRHDSTQDVCTLRQESSRLDEGCVRFVRDRHDSTKDVGCEYASSRTDTTGHRVWAGSVWGAFSCQSESSGNTQKKPRGRRLGCLNPADRARIKKSATDLNCPWLCIVMPLNVHLESLSTRSASFMFSSAQSGQPYITLELC